jgi:hypothetical protein
MFSLSRYCSIFPIFVCFGRRMNVFWTNLRTGKSRNLYHIPSTLQFLRTWVFGCQDLLKGLLQEVALHFAITTSTR